jgi:hypothetical protein
MKIAEGQLRRMVRGIILEDLQSFIDAATKADLNYNAAQGDPLLLHPRNKEAKRQARVLKNLWRQHSNQESFRRLTFVHWFSNAVESVPEFVHSSGKDEISTSISSPDDPIGFTRWGVIGIQMKGWVTFAGNNMNQIMSGYMDRAKAKDRAKYGEAGIPKRPLETTPRSWDTFALDAGDLTYDPDEVNEAILDNWRPVAWVISEKFMNIFKYRQRRSDREELLTMIEAIRNSGLPVINTNRELVGVEALERAYNEAG